VNQINISCERKGRLLTGGRISTGMYLACLNKNVHKNGKKDPTKC